ncbi:transposase, partial [Novosphingobium pokkalii]
QSVPQVRLSLSPCPEKRHHLKLHCLADAVGRPVAFHLTGGEAADCKAYDDLIDLPEQAPDAFLADKGYDADAIRADLAERKIKAVIPGRSNRA